MKPGDETMQQSIWSAGIHFAHALLGSDLAAIIDRFDQANLFVA